MPWADNDGPYSVNCLAARDHGGKTEIWAGSINEGVFVIDLATGKTLARYTSGSTGVCGRLAKMQKDTAEFLPDAPLSNAEIERLGRLAQSGLFLRLNTEVFRIKKLSWPKIKVVTYGVHDFFHSGAETAGLDRAVILSGLPDDNVNDILIDGATVWFATGVIGDKGLSGGLAFLRDGVFAPLYPDAVFNESGRFNWQRSQAGTALAGWDGRIWNGWGEIRGLKYWGGMSGNLLNFKGDGLNRSDWKDFTRPIGINHQTYDNIEHLTVSDLAGAMVMNGSTAEDCVLAATTNYSVIKGGRGAPLPEAWGAEGLRLFCVDRLAAIIARDYGTDHRPLPGAPSSNFVTSVVSTRDPETGKVYAIAGTDAGLYVVELLSHLRRDFYRKPEKPEPAILVGSNFNLGSDREGEVLHGMTVGSADWPPCLPDMLVSEVKIEGEPAAEGITLWAGTYGGLARYRGPVSREGLQDCSRWTSYYYHPAEGEISSGARELVTAYASVNAVLPVKTPGAETIVLGLGPEWMMVSGLTGALRRADRESARRFPGRAITHARLIYSADYENPQEVMVYPDSAATNLYTPAFHAKSCSIDEPQCLLGDSTANWKHFDAMTDALVRDDLTPTFDLMVNPPMLYFLSLQPDHGGPCSPPDPDRAECAPSRLEWDFRQWENLLFAMTDHLYRRYGVERVSRWTFEIGNEYGVEWMWPWHDSFAEDYAVVFRHARRAVDAACAYWKTEGIRIAGPSWQGDPSPPGDELKRVLGELKDKRLKLDVLTTHLYPIKSMDMTPWVQRTAEIADRAGFEDVPIAVTEYGMIHVQGHDGTAAQANSEIPALWLIRSIDGISKTRAPEMMYALDFNYPPAGPRSNWPLFFGYPNLFTGAPRPAYNLILLAAQAGEEALGVKLSGDVSAFARHDPYSGQVMVFLYRDRIKSPWKETAAYQGRKSEKVKFNIAGLDSRLYRVREFVIDAEHSNFLTSLWRAGSPSFAAGDTLDAIEKGSALNPLAAPETSLPPEFRGDSVAGEFTMEDESIRVIELTPSPEIYWAANDIELWGWNKEEGQGLKLSWQDPGGGVETARERTLYKGSGWTETRDVGEPFNGTTRAGQDSTQSCSASAVFNGAQLKVDFQWMEDTGAPSHWLIVLSGDQGRWTSEIGAEGEYDGVNVACLAGGRGNSLHLVYKVRDGGLVYRRLALIADGGDGVKAVFSGPPRPVSDYGPFPGKDPATPEIIAGPGGDLHLAWIERDARAFGRSGGQAIVYQRIRD